MYIFIDCTTTSLNRHFFSIHRRNRNQTNELRYTLVLLRINFSMKETWPGIKLNFTHTDTPWPFSSKMSSKAKELALYLLLWLSVSRVKNPAFLLMPMTVMVWCRKQEFYFYSVLKWLKSLTSPGYKKSWEEFPKKVIRGQVGFLIHSVVNWRPQESIVQAYIAWRLSEIDIRQESRGKGEVR